MPFVKWPVVIRHHERPSLPRHSRLHWILINVINRAPHVVGMIKKHFPSASSPRWMFARALSRHAKPQAAYGLEVLDHLFGAVSMLASHEVDVVAHDRTGVACIPAALDDFGKSICNQLERSFAQFEKWILQAPMGLLVERPNIARARLDPFSAKMQFTEIE